MSKSGFYREYCLKWMDSIGEVFPQELINRVVNHDTPPKHYSDKFCVAGLDLGKQRNKSVLTIAEVTPVTVKVINIIDWDRNKILRNCTLSSLLQRDYPNLDLLVIDETGEERSKRNLRKRTNKRMEKPRSSRS